MIESVIKMINLKPIILTYLLIFFAALHTWHNTVSLYQMSNEQIGLNLSLTDYTGLIHKYLISIHQTL